MSFLKKHPAGIAGFFAGALACIVGAAAMHVIYNGQGLGDPAPRTEVVYPNW